MNSDAGSAFVGVVLIFSAFVLAIGLLPTFIAFRRQHPNRWLILAVNCVGAPFFGFGWLVALIWALRAVHRAPENSTGSDGGESGLNVFVNDEKRIRLLSRGLTPASKSHQLTQLAKLRKDGALSEAEYNSLKAEVLSRPVH